MIGPPVRVWIVDFEFHAPSGGRPEPICVVAHELSSGAVVRRWLWNDSAPRVPFDLGLDDLYVAFYASAEIGCHLVLGWPLPERVVDLYAEHRIAGNGVLPPGFNGLLAALACRGLAHPMGSGHKDLMRKWAIEGGTFDATQRELMLSYCEADVIATARLLKKMLPTIDMPRAELRGEYTASVARMEFVGVPTDVQRHRLLHDDWRHVRWSIGYMANSRYPGVFTLKDHDAHFNQRGFAKYLRRHSIFWPRTSTGRLKLDDDTFSTMVRANPGLRRLHEARKTLARMRTMMLAVGPDGRNRTLLAPFASKTGRNQPSNSKSIFGAPKWLRSLVRPEPGRAIAYIDYSSQEFGIAAALSDDPGMLAAYRSGDPYIAFAVQAGAAPIGATKATHAAIRNTYKVVVVAAMYGMGPELLAAQLGADVPRAKYLLAQHRRAFPTYWKWSDSVATTAQHRRVMTAPLGWHMRLLPGSSTAKEDRTVRNWPVQSTASEMLRVAVVETHRRGVTICMPVHDALLVEADEGGIDEAVRIAMASMAYASRIVLDDKLILRADVDQLVRHPGRYRDKDGAAMWADICRMLGVPP